jgi:hypothetical protein
MGFLDDIMSNLKKQTGKHYRLTRADDARQSVKRAEGYENVTKTDPEIRGTILERNAHADGSVRIGGLVIHRTSEEQREKLQQRVDDRTRAREESIKRQYLEEGERVRRSMGKDHGKIKFIAESKEE